MSTGGLAINTQISTALVYYIADLNLRVFPLHDVESGVCSCPKAERCGKDSGKHPRVTAWQKEATNDLDKVINRWWKKWPNANIGIPTGRHLWFNYPENQLVTNSKGGFPLGIDIRGDGGYILAPPSKTLKGEYHFANS